MIQVSVHQRYKRTEKVLESLSSTLQNCWTLLVGEASILVCIAAWKVICINTRADSSMNLKTNPHKFKLNKKTLSFLQNFKKSVILSTHFCSSKPFIVKPFSCGGGDNHVQSSSLIFFLVIIISSFERINFGLSAKCIYSWIKALLLFFQEDVSKTNQKQC